MRLARMWDFRSQDQEVLYSVDFVVVDRQVHFCPSCFLVPCSAFALPCHSSPVSSGG